MDDGGSELDVVLGVGNPLMGDDGLGIAALGHLRDKWQDASDLTLVDGGTWGMNLLPIIEQARRLLVIDAIDRGLDPGSRVVLERDEIPRYFGRTLSPHQLDLREVLALAELRGTLPRETIAMGIQPDHVELSLDLSSVVAASLPRLVSDVDDLLRRWGHVAADEGAVHA